MPNTSTRLGLPYLQPSQAQKHVTHNEALHLLDAVVQLTVIGVNAVDPPTSPAPGSTYALGPSPTGVWSGQGGHLAFWDNAAWQFIPAHDGWRAWDLTSDRAHVFGQGAWRPESASLDNLDGMGIGAEWDAANRLVVASEATLLTHAGNGHQLKLNKAEAADTASVLFQTDFDGRAELGLTGSDAFSVKMRLASGDWAETLRMDPAAQSVTVATGAGAEIRLTEAGLALNTNSGGSSGWQAMYGQENVLGTVSQASGRITGALLERGANANGEYVRFADGTQICTRFVLFDSVTGNPVEYSLPAAFAAGSQPAASIALHDSIHINRVRDIVNTAVAVTPTIWRLRGAYPGLNGSSQFVLCAIGRWF
jgi:hypothetical protein